MTETFIIKRNFGTGKNNFGYIPDPPEPPSDEWLEEHCPKCKHYREYEENGKCWAGCDLPGCEFEEVEEEIENETDN